MKKLLEKDIVSQVRLKLKLYESIGDIIWWERLNSGKVSTNGRYVQMCRKGTPDFVCVLSDKEEKIHVIFFEIKRNKNSLRDEQINFKWRYERNGIHISEVTSTEDLLSQIRKIRSLPEVLNS